MADDQEPTGNTEEDWKIFKILCKDVSPPPVEKAATSAAVDHVGPGDDTTLDVNTALRSEIAGLQYTKDSLTNQITEMRGTLCARDVRLTELQLETERLLEQAARQGAALAATRQRLQDAEARERALQVRSEMCQQALQRDVRTLEERLRQVEKRNLSLELHLTDEEQAKDSVKAQFQDLVRRMSMALDLDPCDANVTPDVVLLRAGEIVQEVGRLRAKYNSTADALASSESDVRALRDALQRAAAEREVLMRQGGTQGLELARLREALEHRCHDLQGTKERLAQSEEHSEALRTELQTTEERLSRLHMEHRGLMQALWTTLGGRGDCGDGDDVILKDKAREVVTHNQDLALQVESLRDKLSAECARACDLQENIACRERAHEARVAQMQGEIDSMRREHCTLHSYLQRLCAALAHVAPPHVEADTCALGEQLLTRAEHLVRVENDRMCCDKVHHPPPTPHHAADCHDTGKPLCYDYSCTLPRLRRERSCHDIPLKEQTSVVYGLQRRVRVLKEQLQRKELHLELMRRKLALQEEGVRNRHLLQAERDDAANRAKRSARLADRLTAQLAEANAQIRTLTQQLAEAADCKIAALERARKIEELQQRLQECENLRFRNTRQLTMCKEHCRVTEQNLRDEVSRLKNDLSESTRQLSLLNSFKSSISKLLSLPPSLPDFEIISKLQRLINAHREYVQMSRRIDDPPIHPPLHYLQPRTPLRPCTPPRSPLGCSTRTPDRSFRYDDGYDFDEFKDI